MDNFRNIENLCRVCLCDPEELDVNNQLIFLNPQQIEKLIYIGDSSEIVRLDEEPLTLCLLCYDKLDWVYEFVVKFNSSKAKIREYARRYDDDPYHVVDLNLETIDTNEDYSDNEESNKFVSLIKVENSPPPYESPYRIESPYPHEYADEPIQHFEITSVPSIAIKVEPNTVPRIGPKSMTRPPMNEEKRKLVKTSSGMPQFNSSRMPQSTTVDTKAGLKDLLKRDSVRRSTSSPENNVCNLCNKQFSTRANMLRHVREHLGRRFVCYYENCKSFFTQKSSLQVHIARHEGHQPYSCDYCGKKFSQSKSLVFHIRIHTGESPYECDYCQKRFKQKSNLIRHFKSHRKQQPPRQKRFECKKCSKFLASKQSLIRHMNRHERVDEEVTRVEGFKIERNVVELM